MSLLDDAKKIKTKKKFPLEGSKDKCELAIAYLKGEIRPIQIQTILGLSNSERGALHWVVCKILMAGLESGLIEIRLVDK